MNPHPAISSYLARPGFAKPKLNVAGLQKVAAGVYRTNPHIIPRLAAILLVWSLLIGAFQFAGAPRTLPGQAFGLGSGVSADASLPVAGGTDRRPQMVATAARATVLAGDPTGQMLPPIAMAPPGSIRNPYTWGECTWYVAGRRQVPRNWGNANTWYSRAAAAGWSVGGTPAVGAIAQTTAGSLGHVALVEQISVDYQQVYVSEMNYAGRGVKSYRWVPSASFHYIY